jgi:hypothetical protein
MSHHHPLPPPTSIAAQARAATAELAMAARHGAIGAGTVLAYTARINRALVTLAEYERTLDELTIEAMAEARAREAATAAGQLVELRPRRPIFSPGGGRAA